MMPDEIIKKLEQLNIKITRRTLLNYEKQGLIDEPIRGSKGRGRGRTTEYSDNEWIQVYTVYRLIHDEKIPIKHLIPALKAIKTDTDSHEKVITDLNTNHTMINISTLHFQYAHAAIAHIPYGGMVFFIREQSFSEEGREEFWKRIENDEPIYELPNNNSVAIVIVLDSDELRTKKISRTFVLMWDDVTKKWEHREDYFS